jgi:hypothetical protein
MLSLRKPHKSAQNASMRSACAKCMHMCQHSHWDSKSCCWMAVGRQPACRGFTRQLCSLLCKQAMVPMPRFAASLANKMAREEYHGLRNRTAVQTDGRLSCICLVAVRPGECVCGSLDLRLPAEASGNHPPGVPEVGLTHECMA